MDSQTACVQNVPRLLLNPGTCQLLGSSHHKVTKGLLMCLSCPSTLPSPSWRNRKINLREWNKDIGSVFVFLSISFPRDPRLKVASPPKRLLDLMTMSDWWSSLCCCFATYPAFPFCLEFPISLLTAQSWEISTLLSEEGHNNERFHNSKNSLYWVYRLWCCHFFFFLSLSLLFPLSSHKDPSKRHCMIFGGWCGKKIVSALSWSLSWWKLAG